MNARAAGRAHRRPSRSRRAHVPRGAKRGNEQRPANHVTLARDRLEWQAESFAKRISRGEQDVAQQGLLRAPAASFSAPGSHGRPLATALRDELEPALGADLGAIRIHTDAPAAEAVSAVGAAAVAAGAHVFFATHRYDDRPDLLVHELVHVLQQTAVRGSPLGLSARDVHGEGPAQASPREHPLGDVRHPTPDVEELIVRHEAVGAATEGIRADLEARAADLPAYWDELEAQLLAGARPGAIDEPLLALQVDLLKREQRFAAVAEIIDRFRELPTTYFDASAYSAWPDDRGYDFVYDTWARLSLFADHRPDAWFATYEEFLLGLTRPIPAFGEERPLEALVSELHARLEAGDGRLIPNERAYAVLTAVEWLDGVRVHGLEQMAASVGGGTIGPEGLHNGHRRTIAQMLVATTARIEKDGGTEAAPPELQALLRAIAPGLREVAAGAVAFWADVERFGALLDAELTDELLGDPARLLARLARRAETAAFEAAILPSLDSLFALGLDAKGERNEPLAPDAYLDARDTVLEALAPAIAAAFEAPMLAERERAQPDRQLLVALGFAQALAAELRAELAVADATMPPDRLLAHRLHIGGLVAVLGIRLDRADLTELGLEAMQARREEQTRTQLALLSDWRPDPSPITRLTDDLHPLLPVRDLGLTPDELVDFYLTAYYEDYASGIRAQLDDLSGPETAIQRAAAKLDRTSLPQRYKVDQFRYALSPVDQRPWGDIIKAHPKSETKPPPELFRIWPAQFVEEVFAWTLPPLEPLVTRLKAFGDFSVVIAAHRLGVPAREIKDDHPELVAVSALAWHVWFDEFVKAFRTPTPEATEARAALERLLAAERELGMGALETTMREASSLERQHRVETQLAPALEAYEGRRQLAKATTPFGELVTWDIPERVLDELARLVGGFGPAEERPLHETAALLELAPQLHDALAGEPRFDLLVAFHPRLEATLADTAGERLPLLLPLLQAHGERDAQIAAWVRDRAAVLAQLKTALETTAAVGQRTLGFQALLEGGAGAVAGVGHSTLIPVGKAFTIDGVEWTITRIHRAFTYHPTFGPGTPSVVVIGDRDLDAGERAGLPLLDVRRGQGETQTIAADNAEVLDALSRAVTLEALAQQLGELAKLIEGATNLALDLVEFVPGPGQIVMATRLVAAIYEFVNSPEFEKLAEELVADPSAAFAEVTKLLGDVFTPEKLWEWLLFGRGPAGRLRATTKATAKPPAGAPKTLAQRLARLVARIVEAGRVIFQSLLRTQTRIRWRVEAVQLSVLGFPLLARALRLIAENIDVILDAAESLEGLDEALDGFGERIAETAAEVANFELPLELIPLSELVDVIVQLILSRLPGKFKIAGTVVLRLLDLVGQREAVFKAIAAAYPPELDPNEFWRAEIRTRIAPQLQAARDEFAAAVFGTLAKVPPLDQHAGVLGKRQATVPTGAVEPVDVPVSDLLEAEALPAPGAPVAPGTPVALPSEPGRPLAATARSAYEARLGHDLGHVRVHDSHSAAAATERVGARALTAGSHVYLGHDLAGDGGRVVAHELAHVVQQTGPRPLDARHSHTPARGHAGRGLIVDQRREAQAEAVAAGAGRPTVAGAQGVEPNFPHELLQAFLQNVASEAEVQSAVEIASAATRPATVPDTERRRVPPGEFFDSFTQAVEKMKLARWLSRVPVRAAIERHLGRREEPHNKAVRSALDGLILDSLRPESELPGAKPKAKAKPVAPGTAPVWVIDPARLAVALARVVFAETGILVEFDVGPGRDGKLRVRSMRALYVHLPDLHGNNDLWNLALEDRRGKPRIKGDERAKLMPRLRSTLAGKDVTSEVWESGAFRLTNKFLDDVKAAQLASKQPTLPPSSLPSKAVYLAESSTASPIGIRRGTHGVLTGNLGAERNSHHVTQYLLVEYFGHTTKKRPFPLVDRDPGAYPGLQLTGRQPNEFAAPGNTVRLGSLLKPGRGDHMPAISLSEPTHETGRLHLELEKGDELLTGGQHSQGSLVHGFFTRALPAGYKQAHDEWDFNNDPEPFKQYKVKKGDTTVAAQIHDAIQQTYADMSDRLETRLVNALMAGEVGYFNALAELKNPVTPEEVTPGEMKAEGEDAIRYSKRTMRTFGWGT